MGRKRRIVVVMTGIAAIFGLLSQGLGVATGPEDGPFESDAVKVTEADLEADALFGLEVEFVSGSSFHPLSSSETWSYQFGGCISGGQVESRVDLPHAADISSVSAHIRDTGTATDGSLQMWRFPTSNTTSGTGPSAGAELVYSISTGNGDDSGFQTLSDTTADTAGADIIDSNTYTYDLRWNGPNDANTQLCGVKIFFTLPDSTNSLVFHELTPCAIFDTRPGQGGIARKLNSGETITFDTIMSGGDYSSQGGSSTCTSPPTGTSGSLFGNVEGTVAVLLNLVALQPDGTGNLKVWDEDVTEPDGGVLVFNAGENNANEIAVAVDDGSCSFFSCSNGGLINVKNQSDGAHVRGVILGYYTRVPRNQE